MYGMDKQKVDQATGKLEQDDKTKEAYIIDEGVHSSLILPAANPKRHFIYNEGGCPFWRWKRECQESWLLARNSHIGFLHRETIIQL